MRIAGQVEPHAKLSATSISLAVRSRCSATAGKSGKEAAGAAEAPCTARCGGGKPPAAAHASHTGYTGGTLLQCSTLKSAWDALATPGEQRMDTLAHNAIAGRLEAGKTAGWLSEYLVAWHGTSDALAPNVTVWRAADQNDDAVRIYLNGLLAGLVPESDIIIAET
jgi:hypothetical protein